MARSQAISSTVDCTYINGLCSYYADQLDEAIENFKRTCELEPKHSSAERMLLKAEHLQQLKAKGAEYIENEKFPEALEVYNEAIKLSAPNKARTLDILHKTAQVQFNMCLFDEAIETCDTALDLDEKFFNALRLRARCHYKLSHLTLAENDYREAILRSDESQRESLIEDLMEVKTAKIYGDKNERNWYEILGVDQEATTDEIKNVYKRKAILYHPDKTVGWPEHVRTEREEMFKLMTAAKAKLSRERDRKKFDEILIEIRRKIREMRAEVLKEYS